MINRAHRDGTQDRTATVLLTRARRRSGGRAGPTSQQTTSTRSPPAPAPPRGRAPSYPSSVHWARHARRPRRRASGVLLIAGVVGGGGGRGRRLGARARRRREPSGRRGALPLRLRRIARLGRRRFPLHVARRLVVEVAPPLAVARHLPAGGQRPPRRRLAARAAAVDAARASAATAAAAAIRAAFGPHSAQLRHERAQLRPNRRRVAAP